MHPTVYLEHHETYRNVFMLGSTGFVCPDQWSEPFAPEAKTGEAAQSVAKVTSKLARHSAEFMGIQAQLGDSPVNNNH
jgi:hypothetical protein